MTHRTKRRAESAAPSTGLNPLPLGVGGPLRRPSAWPSIWRCLTCRWPVEAQRHGYPAKRLAAGGHDGSFPIVGRVGRVDFVVGVRSHTGEVLSVHPMDRDIEKLVKFLSRKHD
jgi:hypothetical protein